MKLVVVFHPVDGVLQESCAGIRHKQTVEDGVAVRLAAKQSRTSVFISVVAAISP